MLKIIKNFLFSILPKNKFFKYKKCDFVFLVHPRNVKDIKRNFNFLKYFPDFILSFCGKYIYPFILSSVRGIKNRDGRNIRGYIISCPITGAEMLKNKKLAKKRILQAIKLSEKLGARIVGLGGFISSVTNGGVSLIKKTSIFITTGNTYTAAIACNDIKKICKKLKRDINKIEIAVIGATGSIGSAIAKSLLEQTNNLILIGRTEKKLLEFKKKIKKISNDTNIVISLDINDIKSADIIIMATANSDFVLLSQNIKKNSIIYSISQPSNISKCVKKRKDILMFKGGLVIIPNIKHHVRMGLPKGINFACFSEIILLAMDGVYKNFIGKVQIDNINFIEKLAEKYNFKSKLFK